MNTIKLMSFNIRVDVPSDGAYAWPNRKEQVVKFILNKKVDIVGIQEAGPHMLAYLKEHLFDYDAFGIGRDQWGESTPLFVKKNEFELLESNTIWLTSTPLVPSNIIGSNHPRIATYAVLKTSDQKMIAVFNTHLDYTGDQTTLPQIKYLHEYVKMIEQKYQALTIINGDFNSYPSSETVSYLKKYYEICFQKKHEHQLTFHGFSNDTIGEPIDYIFFSKKMKIDTFEIIRHPKVDLYLSDHYPLLISLRIE